MANATANINVEVNGLGKLDTLDKKLQALGGKFSGLKTALAGVGFAAFGRQAAVAADEVIDLSNASGIAVGRLLELQGAIEEAGGKAGAMTAAVSRFTLSIDEAAQGSLKLQSAFGELGISFNDLNTLSEADLLAKAVDGFGKITDKSRQAALMTDLFGKSMRGVDANKLRSELENSAGTMDKYAESVKQASDLNGKLDRTLMNLNIAFLKVTAPFVEFINKFAEGGQNIDKLVTIIKVLGTVLLAVFGGGLLMGAVRVIGTLGRSISAVAGMFKKMPPAAKEAAEGVAEAATKMTNRFEPGSRLMRALRGAAVLIGSIGGAALGMIGLGGAGDAKPEAGAKPPATEPINRAGTEGIAKKRQEIENITKAYKQQNAQLIDNLNVEKMLVGKSQEEADILRAQEEIYKRGADEAEKLRAAKQALGKDEQGLTAVYDAQIKKIQEQTAIDVQRVTGAMQGLHGLKLLEQDRLNNIERINVALQKQIAFDQSLLQIRQQTQGQLGEAEFEGAQMKRSPLERQFAGIQESARKAALEASRAFSEQFSSEDMGAEDAKKLADGLALIAQRYQAIANIQSANLSQSRTWEEGWKSAFDSYIENSTNAAKVAGDAFSSFTSNMNSAIDNFVDTGKFSFGDFARSVIQDLIKIELKAQASKILSGVLSGAGSFFSSLLGFAEGGQPPINKPSIVGERGPELFIPKTAGTIVPNGGSAGGAGQAGAGGNTYITNNISAVDAKSVAQLFAENRKTLFGTVEMARKEMSYGR
jgi:lambda family phage tail tape measure protein